MPDLRQTRKKMKAALAVMVAVDVLAAVIYFSPLVGSAETRRQEMNTLQTELNIKSIQVKPLKTLDKKVVLAKQQISAFYQKRLPAQDSQILTEFGKVAAANGVTIDQAKYKTGDVGPARLEPVEVAADLTGNYVSLAKFINALERDEMLFIINSITLGSEQQGPIKLQMKLETFLKVGA